MKAYAIKAHIVDIQARHISLAAQKTMYGGKQIAAGDVVYVFASENEGGKGLFAQGIVTHVQAIPKLAEPTRQTPRVDVTIQLMRFANKPMGRTELRHYTNWQDGLPATELNFKLYRQATNKLVGISDAAAAFLASCL